MNKNKPTTIHPYPALLLLTIVVICTACTAPRTAERHDYMQSGGITVQVDTTRTLYTLEVINEFARDTVTRTIYRETKAERRGVTALTDTIYIHKTDTVFHTPAPTTTGTKTKAAFWGLVAGALLSFITSIIINIRKP